MTRCLTALLMVAWLSGCCIDPEANARKGNIITYENGKVCTDSTQRGLSSSAKICAPICKRD